MNKKHSRIGLWVCILVAFVLFLLEANKGIFQYSVAFGNKIRVYIHNAKSFVSDTFDSYTNQAEQIKSLQIIKEQKEKNDILIANLQSEVAKMQQLINLNIKPRDIDTLLVRAYSFVDMGQYLRIWLEPKDSIPSKQNGKVFGLIKDNYTAGIALYKDDLLLGILNGDPKVSYGVYIGEDKNIGILKKDINGKVVVEYINAWSEIKEGDEVITNGLDNIFFEGIGVGKVKKVRQEFSYIVAEVELYSKNNDIGYFWLVDMEH